MELYKKVKEIILLSDDHDKEIKIEELGDYIEYSKDIQNEDLIKGVSLLLEYGLKLNKGTLKESVFSTIFTSIQNYNIAQNIDWDNLAANILDLDEECLDYSLSFLGFSHNKMYINVISKYLNHSSSDIQESADEAIRELNANNV